MHILHSSFLANILFLSLSITFINSNDTYTADGKTSTKMKMVAIMMSTGIAFLQFCGIVLYPLILARLCSSTKRRCCPRENVDKVDSVDDSVTNSYPAAADRGYRDSILNESQPLLPTY